ncbi:MAG: MmgE/PrpD family protein [Chloroflexi bacterium]|nr:MmgE/PrpD family protein [Chloroflexota bacterium]
MDGTASLAAFVSQIDYAQLPAEARDIARQALLDGIGVALAGSQEACAQIMASYVRDEAASPQATVLGLGMRASPELAALANGTLAHALDFDDFTPQFMSHTTVSLMPALLAVGEVRHISGQQAIAAYAAGYEVQARVGLATGPGHYEMGWHSTSTLGALGATAAAGRVLGLSPQQMQHALGMAASGAGGLRQNFGTMTKPLHAGLAASHGVRCALLAARGFTGDQQILEAPFGFCKVLGAPGEPRPELLTQGLGGTFYLAESGVDIKPYPSCRETHRCLDAVLHLVHTHTFRPEDVVEVECHTSAMIPHIVIHQHARTVLEGKFCMPFCMAVAIVDRAAGLDQFTDERLRDPRVQELMGKVHFHYTPEDKGRLEDLARPETVVVRLHDGRAYSHTVSHALGSPTNPMPRDQLWAKYRLCASRTLPPAAVARSLDMLAHLEDVPDVADLMSIVTGGP